MATTPGPQYLRNAILAAARELAEQARSRQHVLACVLDRTTEAGSWASDPAYLAATAAHEAAHDRLEELVDQLAALAGA